MRVSRNLKTIHYKAEKYRQDYQRTNGREPTVDEICAEIGSEPEDLVMAMESAAEVSNIEDMGELQSGRREEERVVEKLYVKQLLDTLPDKEKRLITLRYFGEKTQGETGRILGMSQVQVSRLEKKILRELKRA